MKRADVEGILAEAIACTDEDTWHLWAPEMAELCRTWLAVQDAELVTATEDHDGGPAVIYPRTIEFNEGAWLIKAAKP